MTARRTRGLPLVMAIALAIVACKTGATGGTTVTPGGGDTPDEGADPIGRDSDDGVAEMTQRLRRLGEEYDRTAAKAEGFGACEDLCELASKICQVKESLCEVADRHPADDSYQALCREATHECHEANQSCIRCAQQGGGGSGKER